MNYSHQYTMLVESEENVWDFGFACIWEIHYSQWTPLHLEIAIWFLTFFFLIRGYQFWAQRNVWLANFVEYVNSKIHLSILRLKWCNFKEFIMINWPMKVFLLWYSLQLWFWANPAQAQNWFQQILNVLELIGFNKILNTTEYAFLSKSAEAPRETTW